MPVPASRPVVRCVSRNEAGRRGVSAATVALVLALVQVGQAQSGPVVPLQAEFLLRGRPAEGLLVLRSGIRDSPLLQADALVFLGAGSDPGLTGDVLVMTVQVREPHGYGSARLGRFMLNSGAVRPVQIDGLSLLARAPIGTSLELFAGIPVLPEFGPRSFDWLAGGRVGQQVLDERCVLGLSYIHRRDAGQLADEEVGADLTIEPLDWLSLGALGAWDLVTKGLAEARAAATAHRPGQHLELYFSQRVASRLLPATSLFSVIGQTAGTQAGASAGVRAFPRLELGGNVAVEGLAGDLGYSVGLQGTLFVADDESGRIMLDATRRDLDGEGWTAGAVRLWLPLTAATRAHASAEVALADEPRGRGRIWPWLRIGASHLLGPSWTVAAAAGIQATPRYRSETYGLLRLAYHAEVFP